MTSKGTAQSVLDRAEAAYAALVTPNSLNFRPPTSDDLHFDGTHNLDNGDSDQDKGIWRATNLIDIFYLPPGLVGTTEGGYAHVDECAPNNAGGFGRIAISGDSRDDVLQAMLAHEIFHLVQAGYRCFPDLPWSTRESSASAIELLAPPQNGVSLTAYPRFSAFTAPGNSIYDDGSLSDHFAEAYGGWIWWSYIAQRCGPSSIREIWELIGKSDGRPGLGTTDAIDRVLHNHGTDAAAAFTDFAWRFVDTGWFHLPLALPDVFAPNGSPVFSDYESPVVDLPGGDWARGYVKYGGSGHLLTHKVTLDITSKGPSWRVLVGQDLVAPDGSRSLSEQQVSLDQQGAVRLTIDPASFGTRRVDAVYVVAANPTSVHDGAEVKVCMSPGELGCHCTVPDCAQPAAHINDAIARLTAAGLREGPVTQLPPEPGAPAGGPQWVVDQDPAPGSEVPCGSAVRLSVQRRRN